MNKDKGKNDRGDLREPVILRNRLMAIEREMTTPENMSLHNPSLNIEAQLSTLRNEYKMVFDKLKILTR
jgi:hypothetical protein